MVVIKDKHQIIQKRDCIMTSAFIRFSLAFQYCVKGAALSFFLFTASFAFAASPVLTASGSTTLTYQLAYSGTPTYFRVYLSTTPNPLGTGYPISQTSANYLIEKGSLYKYAGTSGSWNWTFVKQVSYTNKNKQVRWVIANTDLGSPTSIAAIGQVEAPLQNSAKISQVLSPSPDTSGTQKVSYVANTASFANPERGFYHYPTECNSGAFDVTEMKGYRNNESISMVICMFYLKEFVYSPISQAALDLFQSQMNNVRAAGLKAIVRFAYSDSVPANDAVPAQVMAHLDQLAPYFAQNSDVIAVVQTGLIGSWGEWYYTLNYGNEGTLSAANWADRKAIVDKLLQVVPAQRAVQLRTMNYKQVIYGASALSATEAFTGTSRARIGHHNDCFLAAYNDGGSYKDPSVDYPYLNADTTYVPMGGETCAVNLPRSDCPTALDELSRFHWSYLNTDYNKDVLNQFSASGCMEQIKQKLGYRFVLQSGTYALAGKPGGQFTINFTLQNQGWAAPFNSRIAELVLRNTVTGALYQFNLNTDPRLWLGGQTITVNQTITLPSNIPSGNYALFLNLPDPASTLRNRPEYAIQLANQNVWEASTGFNNLQHTMAIAP